MSEHFRRKLIDFIDTKIKNSGKSIPEDFNDESPLITSGLLESLYLLELALLLEEEVGSTLELTILDFTSEWDTINSILDYVNKHSSGSVSR